MCAYIYACIYLHTHSSTTSFSHHPGFLVSRFTTRTLTTACLSFSSQLRAKRYKHLSTGEVEPTEEPLNHLPPVCIVHSITCTPTTHCSLQHSCSSCLPLKNSFAYSLLQRPVFHSYSWS